MSYSRYSRLQLSWRLPKWTNIILLGIFRNFSFFSKPYLVSPEAMTFSDVLFPTFNMGVIDYSFRKVDIRLARMNNFAIAIGFILIPLNIYPNFVIAIATNYNIFSSIW